VDIDVIAGSGGSGGRGGDTTNGTGGTGGNGLDGGEARFKLILYMNVADLDITVIGGDGGYGGNYGRLLDGTGESGFPGESGHGGDANLSVFCHYDVAFDGLGLHARGGDGPEGAGGYEQGASGGDGGDGEIAIDIEGVLMGTDLAIEATGGFGGDGGVAFSDILGNGGYGGDAIVSMGMEASLKVENLDTDCTPGEGGRGNKPMYDGPVGSDRWKVHTPSFDIRNLSLNTMMDCTHRSLIGDLFNVSGEGDYQLIHEFYPIMVIGNGKVRIGQPVWVEVVNSADPAKAEPLPGYGVEIYRIESGEFIDRNVTDENGGTYHELGSFELTSTEIRYIGSYHFIVSTPDKETTKKTRVEVDRPKKVTIVFVWRPPNPRILIGEPTGKTEYRINRWEQSYFETWGFIWDEGLDIQAVSIQLIPVGGTAGDWPEVELTKWVPIRPPSPPAPPGTEPPTEPSNPWGTFYEDASEDELWNYHMRYDVFAEGSKFINGTYIYTIAVTNEYVTVQSERRITILLNVNVGRPRVTVFTLIEDEILEEGTVTIHGTAWDDYNLSRVEVRIDEGMWSQVDGMEEWTYNLSVGLLSEGQHTIEFRSFDGLRSSWTAQQNFTVERAEDPDGSDGTDEDPWTPLVAGLSIVGIAVVILVILFALGYVGRKEDLD
jgi:hypothetical protein